MKQLYHLFSLQFRISLKVLIISGIVCLICSYLEYYPFVHFDNPFWEHMYFFSWLFSFLFFALSLENMIRDKALKNVFRVVVFFIWSMIALEATAVIKSFEFIDSSPVRTVMFVITLSCASAIGFISTKIRDWK